jgi:flagellar assembly protein FliH
MPRVIRRESFQSLRSYSLNDVQREANETLNQARREAESIRRQALAEAERLFEQRKAEGHKHGFEEGRKAGLESLDAATRATAARKSDENMQSLVNALSETLGQFDQQKRRLFAAAETGVIHLGYEIGQRICKSLGPLAPEAARANLRAALELTRHEHDVRLHVNPQDIEGLHEYAQAIIARIDGLDHVELIPDESIRRGGCILRGRTATVDASIDVQLQRVAEAILGTEIERSRDREIKSPREGEASA